MLTWSDNAVIDTRIKDSCEYFGLWVIEFFLELIIT